MFLLLHTFSNSCPALFFTSSFQRSSSLGFLSSLHSQRSYSLGLLSSPHCSPCRVIVLKPAAPVNVATCRVSSSLSPPHRSTSLLVVCHLHSAAVVCHHRHPVPRHSCCASSQPHAAAVVRRHRRPIPSRSWVLSTRECLLRPLVTATRVVLVTAARLRSAFP